MEKMASLDFMERDNDLIEKYDMFFPEWNSKTTDDAKLTGYLARISKSSAAPLNL